MQIGDGRCEMRQWLSPFASQCYASWYIVSVTAASRVAHVPNSLMKEHDHPSTGCPEPA